MKTYTVNALLYNKKKCRSTVYLPTKRITTNLLINVDNASMRYLIIHNITFKCRREKHFYKQGNKSLCECLLIVKILLLPGKFYRTPQII